MIGSLSQVQAITSLETWNGIRTSTRYTSNNVCLNKKMDTSVKYIYFLQETLNKTGMQ